MPDRVDVISVRSGEAQERIALVRGGEEMVRHQSWGPVTPGMCPISSSVWCQSPHFISSFSSPLIFFFSFVYTFSFIVTKQLVHF